MPAKKRKVVNLYSGLILYGVGLRSIVKYIVSHVPEKDVYKLHVVGEKGSKAAFSVKIKQFYEGETLYRHGYRMYTSTVKIEKRYVSYLVKQSLHSKLKKISEIMARCNHLSNDKMLSISMICDHMIREVCKIDKRIKQDI